MPSVHIPGVAQVKVISSEYNRMPTKYTFYGVVIRKILKNSFDCVKVDVHLHRSYAIC